MKEEFYFNLYGLGLHLQVLKTNHCRHLPYHTKAEKKESRSIIGETAEKLTEPQTFPAFSC